MAKKHTHFSDRQWSVATLRRRRLPMILLGVLALAVEPAAAPPTAQGSDCPRNVEEWDRLCLASGRGAEEAIAIARMRGAGPASAKSSLAQVEQSTVDAAHACARAERWLEADRLLRLASLAAVDDVQGRTRRPTAGSALSACMVNSVRKGERAAFEAYRERLRASAVSVASAGQCATPTALTLGEALNARQAADEARCGWLAAAGRARALEGVEFLVNKDRVNGLLSVSSALGAYNQAQRMCSGDTAMEVSKVRARLAKLLTHARSDEGNSVSQAREVRDFLKENSSADLFGVAQIDEADGVAGPMCLENGLRVVMAGRQPLRLSEAAGKMAEGSLSLGAADLRR